MTGGSVGSRSIFSNVRSNNISPSCGGPISLMTGLDPIDDETVVDRTVLAGLGGEMMSPGGGVRVIFVSRFQGAGESPFWRIWAQ